MNKFKYNILFNLFGKLWLTAANFLFVPVYVKYLGLESYGLIGFYTSLLSLLNLFDLGLSTTLSRELSQAGDSKEESLNSASLIRTLESIYWILALLLLILSSFVAPSVAKYWFNSKSISEDILKSSVFLMGFSIAFRFPLLLYSAGLQGLQKQLQLNLISVVIETLRIGITVWSLQHLSNDIRLFFLIQLSFNFLHTVLTQISVWKTFKNQFLSAYFNLNILKKSWNFSILMSLFSISGAVLIQLDKIFFSKILSLQDFGIYSLSVNIGYLPHYLVMAPIYFAIFPHFSRIITIGDPRELADTYHKVSQVSVVLVSSVGFVVFFFPYEVMFLWIGNPEIAEKASHIVRWFSLGTVLHAIVHVTYALKFAHGWIGLAVKFNVIASLVLLPSVMLLFPILGASSGGIVWLIINIVYLILLSSIVHKKIFPNENFEWYISDVATPMGVMLLVGTVLHQIQPKNLLGFDLAGWLILSFILFILSGSLASSHIRRGVKNIVIIFLRECKST